MKVIACDVYAKVIFSHRLPERPELMKEIEMVTLIASMIGLWLLYLVAVLIYGMAKVCIESLLEGVFILIGCGRPSKKPEFRYCR